MRCHRAVASRSIECRALQANTADSELFLTRRLQSPILVRTQGLHVYAVLAWFKPDDEKAIDSCGRLQHRNSRVGACHRDKAEPGVQSAAAEHAADQQVPVAATERRQEPAFEQAVPAMASPPAAEGQALGKPPEFAEFPFVDRGPASARQRALQAEEEEAAAAAAEVATQPSTAAGATEQPFQTLPPDDKRDGAADVTAGQGAASGRVADTAEQLPPPPQTPAQQVKQLATRTVLLAVPANPCDCRLSRSRPPDCLCQCYLSVPFITSTRHITQPHHAHALASSPDTHIARGNAAPNDVSHGLSRSLWHRCARYSGRQTAAACRRWPRSRVSRRSSTR